MNMGKREIIKRVILIVFLITLIVFACLAYKELFGFKDVNVDDVVISHITEFNVGKSNYIEEYYERYKVIRDVIKVFLGKVGVQNTNPESLADQLLEIWHFEIMDNGSTKNEAIQISKKSIVWPLIALLTDIHNNDSLRDSFDPGTYDEIVRVYGNIINHKCEKFEFITKVLHDFRKYEFPGIGIEKTKSFLEQNWRNYIQEFPFQNVNEELHATIIKITIGSIINQKYEIMRVKEGVGL